MYETKIPFIINNYVFMTVSVLCTYTLRTLCVASV